MPKRRVDDGIDYDTAHSVDVTPASKRARTEDDESEVALSKRFGKAKSRHADEDREGEDDEASGDKDEEDKQFEDENAEKIRDAIEAKRKVHGGIADHGIIEAIEMHQFMCHRYLTFSFGPQINFIIGHNGSGKSAVLSAITVALGGKANSTGRGNGLKSFIREGQTVAEVTISLKNQGEEAFKPAEYGKSIIITRRFTKDGSSSWKIKSKDGKVVSTKKDELAAICDHMNIQVDNPMNVLTQDAARQFLGASHPSDKYKFFLRGTQLSQLSDEYDTCLENITQTNKVLLQKRDALPDLRSGLKEATTRYEEASKAREQKKKVDELKKELAWSHVAAKEEEMTKKIQEAAKMSRRLPKIRESVAEAEAKFEEATAEVTRFEADHHNLGNIEHLNDKKRQLQSEMRDNKIKLGELAADEKQMNVSLKATNKLIEEYDARIAEEAQRMAASTQAKREETNRQLDKARLAVHTAEDELKAINEQKRIKNSEVDDAKAKGLVVDIEISTAKANISNAKGMIEKCLQQEKNSLTAYGSNIKQVLETIQGMRWYGEAPIGPLGVHVKVREPEKWAELLRSQLAPYLTAFAITDTRDRLALKKLLEQTGNSRSLIIIYDRDRFDFKRGEPSDEYLTVLRALEISDEYVMRILINQASIERVFLSRTRADANNVLKSVRGGGVAWTADYFRVQIYPEGGGSSSGLKKLPQGSSANLLLMGRDAAGEIQHWRDQMATYESQYQAAVENSKILHKVYNEARRAAEALPDRQAIDRIRQAKLRLNALQEEVNNDLPAGIAGFESAKADAEAEKQSILIQFADVTAQKNKLNEIQVPLLTELNDIKKQIGEFEDKRRAISTKTEDAAGRRLIAQNSKRHYEAKLAEEQAKVAQVEEAAAVLQEEFMNWTKKAEEYCERFPNPRKVDDVQRNLDSVQKALKEREKKHGATVEEMTVELNKARANLETVERDLKNMTNLNKALKDSLVIRLAKWQEFRRHIALRCKLVFGYHLSHRGYYGKVLFDHNLGTLQLKVQTDDQSRTQGRDKDPRSLSGGEKSFSTICLLLSLWESIGCPLRCLDEFDVFMDAVNRRISMKMMIDTANSSDKKQYILITPQDMNNIRIGSSVRVHRMIDPERGQGVLAFT